MSKVCRAAFTLLEVMIVVCLVGLLAVLAIPAVRLSRFNARNAAFVSDLRLLSEEAFGQYSLEQGDFPPDAAVAVEPDGLGPFMPRRPKWTDETAIGGNWDWDRAAVRGQKKSGCYAGLAVVGPNRTRDQMTAIDAIVDDGNLDAGMFRKIGIKYIYILEN